MSKNYAWVVIYDPGDAPFRRGARFSNVEVESMLVHGSFTPGTVVRRVRDGKWFVVLRSRDGYGHSMARADELRGLPRDELMERIQAYLDDQEVVL